MHINDVFAANGRTFSFEFFPPRSEQAGERLYNTIRDLEPLRPSFVSVTCRRGPKERGRTHKLVQRIRTTTSIDATPHLTCVGHSRRDIQEAFEDYAGAGVSNILALGGDPDPDHGRDGDFQYAIDLVRAIKKFNDTGAHPDPRGFGVGVAGFPEGHPDTPNRLLELEHLKAKCDAGADWVCTQLFFDNRDFYDFRERCELAGIDVPILAGIMPITSKRNFERMAEFALGARYPAPLIRSLNRCGDDEEAFRRVGVHWATEQCRDLLDNGVDGIHFYTLNRSTATRDIFANLGARDAHALAIA